MDVGDLRSLYLHELQELCDCEAQVVKALPTLALSAGSAALRSAMRKHAEQTARHEQLVEVILRRHGSSPTPDIDQVATALVKKTEQVMFEVADSDLRDAALIAMIRRIEHHQFSAYSTAEGYAKALYLEIDRHSLLIILEEERIIDRRLARVIRF